jgi:hypothetical protein
LALDGRVRGGAGCAGRGRLQRWEFRDRHDGWLVPGERIGLHRAAPGQCRAAPAGENGDGEGDERSHLRRGVAERIQRVGEHEHDAFRRHVRDDVGQTPVNVLVTRGHTYLKVSPGLLKSQHLPSAACALVCGKYLKMPNGQAKSMLNGLDMSSLLGQVSVPRLTYVRTVTLHGQPAWQMRAGDRSTVYVAAQGPSYPLRVTKGVSRADFTQWNAVTIPPPPPASQVVDLSQLGQ